MIFSLPNVKRYCAKDFVSLVLFDPLGDLIISLPLPVGKNHVTQPGKRDSQISTMEKKIVAICLLEEISGSGTTSAVIATMITFARSSTHDVSKLHDYTDDTRGY